jgi:hypothetical protein
LRELVAAQQRLIAAQQRELDALRAKVEGTPEAGKAPPKAPDEPRSQYENDNQLELATLRARLAKPEAKEKGVVAPIEIDAEVLKSVLAMTENDAQQIIEQTKRAMINVRGEITLNDVTLKNQTITVPAPTNLSEGLLVLIDLIDEHGGRIITLAYDVKNAQGLYLKLRGAAERKKFRQQKE